MEFTQDGTDYCIQWCRASEMEIIEVRQRELKNGGNSMKNEKTPTSTR